MDVLSNSPLKNPPIDYCPPGSERWYKIPDGFDAGKKLFYFDYCIGSDEPEFTLLLVHGNPESSYTFRHIRDHLATQTRSLRIVAVDHIGFGLSDQSDFEMVDMHHASNLFQLVNHLELTNVLLAVHDWGGPIGIGAMIQVPDRVSGLIVLNTTVFPMPSDGYTYRNYPFPVLPWFRTASLVPDALWGGIAAAVVSHGKPQSFTSFVLTVSYWAGRHLLGKIEPGQPEYVWAQAFTTTANIQSSKRMVRQTPYWGHGYRYTDKRHGIQDNHTFFSNIQSCIAPHWGKEGRNIPVSGFFGQWDPCGKDSVIAQWQEHLPRLLDATNKFPDVGHFIEEQKGPEIAEAILEMIATR